MTLAIRPLLLTDVPRLEELDQVLEFTPWTASMFEASVEKAQKGTEAIALGVVDETDTPVGYLIIDVMGFALEAEVLTVGVAPSHQRQGLAQALFSEGLAILSRQIPAGSLFLEVRESNLGARQLYKKLGFEDVGFRKNYYQTDNGREGAILMRLTVQG